MYRYININPGIDFECDAILLTDSGVGSRVKLISVTIYDNKSVKFHVKDKDIDIIITQKSDSSCKIDATGELCWLFRNFRDFVHRKYIAVNYMDDDDGHNVLSIEASTVTKVERDLGIDTQYNSFRREYETFRYLTDTKNFTISKIPVPVYIQITKDGVEYGTEVVEDTTGIALMDIKPCDYGDLLFSNEDDAIDKLESLFN